MLAPTHSTAQMGRRKGMARRWEGELYIHDTTVVGTICQTASGDWSAYGCMDDWNDTDLGTHKTRGRAKLAVSKWVASHD